MIPWISEDTDGREIKKHIEKHVLGVGLSGDYINEPKDWKNLLNKDYSDVLRNPLYTSSPEYRELYRRYIDESRDVIDYVNKTKSDDVRVYYHFSGGNSVNFVDYRKNRRNLSTIIKNDKKNNLFSFKIFSCFFRKEFSYMMSIDFVDLFNCIMVSNLEGKDAFIRDFSAFDKELGGILETAYSYSMEYDEKDRNIMMVFFTFFELIEKEYDSIKYKNSPDVSDKIILSLYSKMRHALYKEEERCQIRKRDLDNFIFQLKKDCERLLSDQSLENTTLCVSEMRYALDEEILLACILSDDTDYLDYIEESFDDRTLEWFKKIRNILNASPLN